MWRSFFSAVGIFLILLGVQTLLVDQFMITTHRTTPRFFSSNKAGLNNWSQNGNFASQQSAANAYAPNTFSLPNYSSNGIPGVGQSAYGPSRYGNTFNNSRFAQPAQVGFNRSTANNRSPFSRASFPNNRNQLANNLGGPAIQVSPRPFYRDRLIQTQDWMPWSLLAVGSLILLAGRRGRGMEE